MRKGRVNRKGMRWNRERGHQGVIEDTGERGTTKKGKEVGGEGLKKGKVMTRGE